MFRLLLIFLFFVALGTMVLWSDEALKLPPAEAGGNIQQEQGWPKPVDRIVYSIDLLIPGVDLRAGDSRIVAPQLWVYEVVHIFVGWLLVALLIAWVTAIARGSR